MSVVSRWLTIAGISSLQLVAQTGVAPAFEVASVRPHDQGVIRPLAAETGPGRFLRRNIKIKDLVCWAYDLPYFQITGGPDWFNSPDLRSNRYDIEGKIGGSADVRNIKLMVHSLLADRFQIRAHREMREVPVYALLVAKNGSTLRTAKDAELGTVAGFQVLYGTISARGTPVASLVDALTLILDRPVLDKTGLDGKYDYTLEFDQSSLGHGNERPYDAGKPSIFTAIEEQLGLRLAPQRASMEMLVIDQIEKPSQN